MLLPIIQRSHDTKAYYISVRLFTPPFSPETVQPVWHVEMVTPNGVDRFAKRGIHLHAGSKKTKATQAWKSMKHQRSGDETMFCFCPGAVGTFVIAVKREGTYSSHVIHRVWALLLLVSLCVCVILLKGCYRFGTCEQTWKVDMSTVSMLPGRWRWKS